jgi:hypothetical protein
MGMLEGLLGDLLLGLTQSPALRWGAAGLALVWIWLVGERGDPRRRLFLLAPLAAAGAVELADLLILGPATGQGARGGWFPYYLTTMEALRRFVSPLGLISLVLAAVLGFRGAFGVFVGLAALSAAYLADAMTGKAPGFFSAEVFGLIATLLPGLFLVQMIAYGLGATWRTVLGRQMARRREDDDDE